jgi:starch phosphorylase
MVDSVVRCGAYSGDALAHGENVLVERLPPELAPLARLASNLWWSWQPGGADVFRAIDPRQWAASGENPVRFLRDVAPARLAAAARDDALVARVRAIDAALGRELERHAEGAGAATTEHPVAYFCAEYALHPSLPIYSGGLGGLAGDWLKEASDSAFPMVAVGLFYRRGFFRQRLDRAGWQHEYWVRANPEELPLRLEVDRAGAPRLVRVELRGRAVAACVWHAQVGRVPLFLLDTDLPENDPVSRFITSTLYVGDPTFRLMQYAILAIGGLRALRMLGVDPAVVHLNEGHAAFAAIELLREGRAANLSFDEALARARARVVFTTHTPVAAGNERYDVARIDEVLGALPPELERDRERVLALGSSA